MCSGSIPLRLGVLLVLPPLPGLIRMGFPLSSHLCSASKFSYSAGGAAGGSTSTGPHARPEVQALPAATMRFHSPLPEYSTGAEAEVEAVTALQLEVEVVEPRAE